MEEADGNPTAGEQQEDSPQAEPLRILAESEQLCPSREVVEQREVGRIFLILPHVTQQNPCVGVFSVQQSIAFEEGEVNIVVPVLAPGPQSDVAEHAQNAD